MADQTQRLEIATVKAEVGSNIVYRFANDAEAASAIPTDSGSIPNLKQVIAQIQEDGADKISVATTIYQSPAAGLAATADGGIFLVQSADADTIYTVWKNQAGAAVNTGKTAMSSEAVQEALTESNEAARAAEDAADVATARTAGFLQPSAAAPVVRDNGLPLQVGDRYFNTAEQAEYLYQADGWAANESMEAVAQVEARVDALSADDGSYQLGFLKSTAGDRFSQEYSVQDYALTQSAPSSLEEAQQALDAVPSQGILNWPNKNYTLDQSLLNAGSKSVLHWLNGTKFNGAYDSALPGLSAGMVEKGFRVRRLRGASATDVGDWWHVRDANYTGGTPGSVNVALTAQTTVRAGASAYEWNFLAKLDNYAVGTGENCAAYMQALKRADGSTWAAVAELRDYTVNPATPSVTFEYDLFANGTDSNNNRVLLDLVAGRRDAAGVRADVAYGLRYRPQANDSANAFLKFGLDFGGAVDVILHGTGTGTQFALDSGTRAVGLDMSTAVYSIAAIRLPDNSPIVMDASGATSFRYNIANSRWELRNGTGTGSLRAGFAVSTFALFDANAQQVLTNRATGWTAVSGATDKTSAYNSSWTQSISASYTQSEIAALATQLALVTKRVGAIQQAQTTHGQIGA